MDIASAYKNHKLHFNKEASFFDKMNNLIMFVFCWPLGKLGQTLGGKHDAGKFRQKIYNL